MFSSSSPNKTFLDQPSQASRTYFFSPSTTSTNVELMGTVNNANQSSSKIVSIKTREALNKAIMQQNTAFITSNEYPCEYLHMVNEYGRTPLYLAIQHGLLESVQALLAQKADVNVKDINGTTPIHCAIDHRQYIIADKLLQNGADPMAEDIYGCTPLHLASFYGDLTAVDLLLKHPKVNKEALMGKKNWTPLHWANYNGHNEVSEKLLLEGADSGARTFDNETPKDLQNQRHDEYERAPSYQKLKNGFNTFSESLYCPPIIDSLIDTQPSLQSSYDTSSFFPPIVPSVREPYGALGSEWIRQHETSLSGSSSSDETSISQNRLKAVTPYRKN